MTSRFVLTFAAGLLLTASFAVTTYDRITTAVMVRCLKTTFGKQGAPIQDLPQCGARWDQKLGHRATRALIADATGPFGALQAGSALSWACAPALLLLVLALVAERPRTVQQWLTPAMAIACAVLYLVAYYVALGATEGGDAASWLAAEKRLVAVTWLPLAGGVLALTHALRSRAASRASG